MSDTMTQGFKDYIEELSAHVSQWGYRLILLPEKRKVGCPKKYTINDITRNMNKGIGYTYSSLLKLFNGSKHTLKRLIGPALTEGTLIKRNGYYFLPSPFFVVFKLKKPNSKHLENKHVERKGYYRIGKGDTTAQVKRRRQRDRDNLHNRYIKLKLKLNTEIPPDLIEAKRTHIQAIRTLREIK